VQFFSNRLGNISHPHNSYEYEDDVYNEPSHSNHYGNGYSAGYDNGYSNRHNDHDTSGSPYSNRQHYPSRDVNAHARGDYSSGELRSDYPQRSYYPNSSEPTYPTHVNPVTGRQFAHIAGAGHRVTEVLVIEQTSFEEMPYAVQALQDYKSVVLNLTAMNPDYTQRAIDFITGGTHAMDGNYERIGDGIFLFTPSCVQISHQTSSV